MNKRKLGVIAGGLVILVTVGFVAAKTYFESRMRESITRELASLPESFKITVGDIQVSWLDSSVVLTDIKGEYKGPSGDYVKFSADKSEAAGISSGVFSHDEATGVVRIARQSTITGLAYEVARQKVTMGTVHYGEITGDIGRIRKDARDFMQYFGMLADQNLLNEPSKRQMVFKALSGLLGALETLRVSGIECRGYDASTVLQTAKIRVTFDSMQTKFYSLREFGAVSFSPISVTVDGQPLCAIGSLGWDSLNMPSFVGLLDLFADVGVPTQEQVSAVFKGQAFGLNNMRLKNVVANMPEDAKTPLFTLADTAFNYEADAVHNVKFGYSGLTVDKNRVQSVCDLAGDATAMLPQQLDFSGGFEAQVDNRNPAMVGVDCKNASLKEASLGAVSLRFAADGLSVRNLVLGSPDMGDIRGFSVNLVDTGVSDVIFAAFADETNVRRKARQGGGAAQQTLTAASARALAVAALAMRRDSLPNQTLKELFDAGTTFLSKSGSSLTLSVAPQKPVPVTELLSAGLTAPERLGIKVDVTTPAPR